ncbi:SsgA family sporulation/cell division regulator [Streptomyces flaveolus]|uniref:SsgA family sporulation/cell division regulator n=1 Tax=Streptomyces flaveolus TaxID=67297 RepID=UPI00339DEE01
MTGTPHGPQAPAPGATPSSSPRPSGDHAPPTAARDLPDDGTREPSGEGDFRVWPLPPRDRVRLNLSRPDGHAAFEAEAAAVRQWPDATNARPGNRHRQGREQCHQPDSHSTDARPNRRSHPGSGGQGRRGLRPARTTTVRRTKGTPRCPTRPRPRHRSVSC